MTTCIYRHENDIKEKGVSSMKNRKGISMISLVVIIIVMLILVSIVTTAGYKYITNANEVKATALGRTIGNAAYRRQNDVASGVSDRFYEGYMFDPTFGETNANTIRDFYAQIELLPTEDLDNNGVPDCLQVPDVSGDISGHIWYVFDAESATHIGSGRTDEFLTKNISYYFRSNLTEEEKKELVRVVLADYATGDGYYVKMPVSVLTSAVNNASGACPNSPTGTHKFTIPTCTEGSICIYNCGEQLDNALGHDWKESTCTAAGFCNRCGVVNPEDPAKGHLMISNDDVSDVELIDRLAKSDSHMIPGSATDNNYAWIADSNKHWHECIRCSEKFDQAVHDRGFISRSNEDHQELCATCGWESVVSKHKLTKTSVTDNTHKVECELCTYTATHRDTGWINGSTPTWPQGHANFHYRICTETEVCNDLDLEVNERVTKVIFKEAHYDNNHDFLCDVCGKDMDILGPANFGDEDIGSYAKIINTTTSTIKLEAFTIDEQSEVAYYQFGIVKPDGTIEWRDDIVEVTSPDEKAQYTFTGLDKETTYTFYVRAYDRNGNSNLPYKVVGTTLGFPDFIGITGKPAEGTYVQGPINIGVEPVETDDPGVRLMYKQNDGTWTGPFPPAGSTKTLKEAMEELEIPITKEQETLDFKFVDDKGNESKVWHYVIENIDVTPPEVIINAKVGDTPTESALSHQAVITIRDVLSGLDKETDIKYGWSTSDTTPPTNLITVKTPNPEIVHIVSLEVMTPQGYNGELYLWVMHGTKDIAGNEQPNDVHSTFKFVVDDEEAILSNISMNNLTPAVTGENKFVKTDGEVTVKFTSSKLLKQNPIVRINGKDMVVTSSGKDYTCTITIDESFDEGNLQLFIGDVMSVNGKVSSRTYTNADLADSKPVFYDKTFPVLEYINKKG